jgi:hypothetical protein
VFSANSIILIRFYRSPAPPTGLDLAATDLVLQRILLPFPLCSSEYLNERLHSFLLLSFQRCHEDPSNGLDLLLHCLAKWMISSLLVLISQMRQMVGGEDGKWSSLRDDGSLFATGVTMGHRLANRKSG